MQHLLSKKSRRFKKKLFRQKKLFSFPACGYYNIYAVYQCNLYYRCKWTLVAERDCDYVVLNFTHIILEEHYDELKVCLKDVCNEDDKVVLTGKMLV